MTLYDGERATFVVDFEAGKRRQPDIVRQYEYYFGMVSAIEVWNRSRGTDSLNLIRKINDEGYIFSHGIDFNFKNTCT